MPRVFIPPPLRPLTGGVEEVDVDGATLRQAFAALEAAHPGIAARLIHGEKIATGLAIAVDGAIATRGLATRVEPASEIHILPAMAGG